MEDNKKARKSTLASLFGTAAQMILNPLDAVKMRFQVSILIRHLMEHLTTHYHHTRELSHL